jgi:hypothetical protein
MSGEFVPTTVDDYPVICEKQLDLPSGAKAIVRRPSVFMMQRRGQVPPEVLAVIAKSTAGEKLTNAEMFTVLDSLIAAAFVSPKVSLKRRKGAVCIDDMQDDDRMAVIEALDLRGLV